MNKHRMKILRDKPLLSPVVLTPDNPKEDHIKEFLSWGKEWQNAGTIFIVEKEPTFEVIPFRRNPESDFPD